MPMVMFGRVVRIARMTPGAFVPPITGFRDVVFVWEAVATADLYQLEISSDYGSTWTIRATTTTLTYTISLMEGSYQSRVKAYDGITLLNTTDAQEFSV